MKSLFETGWNHPLWSEAAEIWVGGGWAMIAIAAIALAIFGIGMRVFLDLRAKRFRALPEKIWRRWIDHPEERRGPIGRILNLALGALTLEQVAARFNEIQLAETTPAERDLKVMRICVSAAPLVGLLGTVTGMLSTFGALATGSGGDKTMQLVAKGISEALITTETGLLIALPGLFFQYQLLRTHERHKAFLTHVETVCTQALYHRQTDQRKVTADRIARDTIARKLYDRLTARAAL